MKLIKLFFHAISVMIILVFLSTSGLAYQVTFEPRLNIIEMYTDNVEGTESDPESDFITTIRPEVSFSAIGQNQGLDFSYGPAYSIYEDHGEYDTLRHEADLAAYCILSRNSRIDISDSFIYTEEPLSDIDASINPGDSSSRTPYYRNVADLTFNNRFSADDVVTLIYQYAVLENEDEDSQLEDYQGHTPSFSWEKGLTDRISNQGTLKYTRGQFDVMDDFEQYYANLHLSWQVVRTLQTRLSYERTIHLFDGSGDENYRVRHPSIGLTYERGEDTRLSISVGHIWIEREKDDDEDRFLFSSDIDQTWRFRRGFFNITGSSGYNESYFRENNLGPRIYYQGGAQLSYQIRQDLIAAVGGSCRTDTYLNTDDDREDRTTTGYAGLTYTGIQYVSAELSYDYRLLDSDEDDLGFQERRITFSITLTPEQAIRILN